MDQEKLKEVLSDEAFVKELLATEKPEDVQAALEARGVSLTLDDIKELGKTINKIQSGEITQEQLKKLSNGELSEDELESVTGGSLLVIGIVSAISYVVTLGGIAGGLWLAVATRW